MTYLYVLYVFVYCRNTINYTKKEIELILEKTVDYSSCEVYFLETRIDGYYPILEYGDVVSSMIYLKKNDIWKVGMTCNDKHGRYKTDIFFGSKKIMLA